MRQQGRTSVASSRGGDGWTAFSYLFGGVIVYGGLGWLLDWWRGTSFFTPVGVLVGMGLGLYLVYARFWHFPDEQGRATTAGPTTSATEDDRP